MPSIVLTRPTCPNFLSTSEGGHYWLGSRRVDMGQEGVVVVCWPDGTIEALAYHPYTRMRPFGRVRGASGGGPKKEFEDRIRVEAMIHGLPRGVDLSLLQVLELHPGMELREFHARLPAGACATSQPTYCERIDPAPQAEGVLVAVIDESLMASSCHWRYCAF